MIRIDKTRMSAALCKTAWRIKRSRLEKGHEIFGRPSHLLHYPLTEVDAGPSHIPQKDQADRPAQGKCARNQLDNDMTTIKLYNTKTRAKQVLAPIDPGNVRMYVCGPTVYDRAHLGNARPVVVFDTLFRLLRHVYGADHVTYARNFTDVDDKINATALARKHGGDPRPLEVLIRERTEETIGWYHADMDALGAMRPTHEPRATAFIDQMVAMIAALIAKDHAYAVQGHVLFRYVRTQPTGVCPGRSVDDMIAGARVEVAPYKEDPMDFVLWKPSSDDEPGWTALGGVGGRDGTSNARR